MRITIGEPPPTPPPTMAHVAIARFYYGGHGALRSNHAKPSTIEAITRAPSPFAVEGIVDDFNRFATQASPKTRAQVLETARVRICELRGWLP